MLEKKKDVVSVCDTELFDEYKHTRDNKIRNEIVEKYLYLAEIISKKFVNKGIDYEDIYQVASIALIKAVERFDTAKGVKFVSFATPTIIGEIKKFFRDKSSVIKIPRRIYEVYQKVNNAKQHLSQQLHRSPRADEIGKYLNIDEESVLEILESWNAYKVKSLNESVYEDENVEFHETLGKTDPAFEKIDNRDYLEKSLNKFNEAEKQFIRMRYFNRKTQKEIAQKFGVSQMYISRLERKVIKRFREILEN